jgi:hypothetical protein
VEIDDSISPFWRQIDAVFGPRTRHTGNLAKNVDPAASADGT